MTIQIKHAFTSLKGDGGDATLVRPSNWNAAHSTTMATGKLIGRLTAGAGEFEEIALSAYMADLLGSADAAALAAKLGLFDTGDVKYTFKTVAPAGWLLLLGNAAASVNSIGSAASGATLRANADTWPLYSLIYDGCADAIAPVQGGRSGNAATDFAANKYLVIPMLVGRSPVGAGAATSATIARVLGTLYGTENHTLTAAQIPSITSNASVSGTLTGTTASFNVPGGNTSTGGGGFGAAGSSSNTPVGVTVSGTLNGTATSNNTGGAAHPILHPVAALNVMVKL